MNPRPLSNLQTIIFLNTGIIFVSHNNTNDNDVVFLAKATEQHYVTAKELGSQQNPTWSIINYCLLLDK